MEDRAKALAPNKVAAALKAVEAWRRHPASPVACPVCGWQGLAVSDLSSRPWAEWYRLTCSACGLDDTLHMALHPPAADLD